MTTATYGHSPFSSSYDPSGAELRKALLLPTREQTPVDRAALWLTAGAGLTLFAGLVRVVTA